MVNRVGSRWVAAAAVLGAAVAALVARRRLVVVTVVGASMAPAFRSGDKLLVRRVDHRTLRRGQVVVFEPPGWQWSWQRVPAGARGVSAGQWFVKRIAALPGDPVPPEVTSTVGPDPNVPPDRFVVLGDARDASTDSRSWGYLPADRVLGVVVRRLR